MFSEFGTNPESCVQSRVSRKEIVPKSGSLSCIDGCLSQEIEYVKSDNYKMA